jgi:hypothetical protein
MRGHPIHNVQHQYVAPSIQPIELTFKTTGSPDNFLHLYTTIPIGNKTILLGTSRVRNELNNQQSLKNMDAILNNEVAGLLMGDCQYHTALSNIQHLTLFSVDSTGSNAETGYGAPKRIIGNPLIENYVYPMAEDDYYYDQWFGSIQHLDMEEKLKLAIASSNTTRKVMLHCNQGEHRSAANLVVLMAKFANVNFNEAYQCIASYRDIKNTTRGYMVAAKKYITEYREGHVTNSPRSYPLT